MENKLAPDSVHNHTHNAPQIGDHSPQAIVNDRTGLFIAILSLILSSVAIGICVMVPYAMSAKVENLQDRAITAEREARVMQERWNDLKVELAKRGIPVSDH